MTDKEKLDAIRAEIHRLVDVRGYDRGMANDLFAFMDSLPNEPVSEDLEESANNYVGHAPDIDESLSVFCERKAFKAGAKWQKEKTKRNRIMSKAEERAFEYYPNIDRKDYPCKELDAAYREVFVLGYHQAEKDLALTWENLRELYIIFAEVDTEIELCKTDIKTETLEYYQEILKRFKAQKGEET